MKIRLASPVLMPDSIVDGEGIRAVLWTQGCLHKCPGCQNPQTHSFDDGFLIDIEEVKEQIDALEVMGVNSLNYLVFPKIIALLMYPFLIGISMFLGVFGGWMAAVYGGFTSSESFITGVQLDFIPFHITYAFIKTIIFAMLLATIPSFHGYYMKGGALEVGKASTVSFVWTSVCIITSNYILTQLLLGA